MMLGYLLCAGLTIKSPNQKILASSIVVHSFYKGYCVVATVERVARDSYGKLLAMLAVRSRDLAACEDARLSGVE